MREKLNESNRFIFLKNNSVWFWIGNRRFGIFVLLVLLFTGLGFYFVDHANRTYQRGFQDGIKKAINPKNPSQELEAACAGLWVGEQNRKYQNKK